MQSAPFGRRMNDKRTGMAFRVPTLVDGTLEVGNSAGVGGRLLMWWMASSAQLSHSFTEAGWAFFSPSVWLELDATVLTRMFPGTL